MIIVIDNYDSFTYNLVHYIGEFEQDIKVIRNDEMSVSEIMDNNPSKIVISPGPCTPKEAGISVELIKSSEVPILKRMILLKPHNVSSQNKIKFIFRKVIF